MMNFDNFESCISYINNVHPQSIYIVGAGQYGEIVQKILQKNDIDIIGYIDKNRTGYLKEKKIFDYNSFDTEADCFIISSYIWREELKEQILKSGVKKDTILEFTNEDIFYDAIEKEFEYKKYTKKNKKFKDLYKGKRCFVIGNGPSLKVDDLEKIKDEFSIACNSIICMYKMTNWRPTFYFCWDNDYCKYMMDKREDMKAIYDNCEYVFTSLGSEAIKYRDDDEFNRIHYVKSMHKYEAIEPCFPLFSEDITNAMYGGGVAAYPMLQLAAYTGVSEIYLLGMDNQYSVTIRDGIKQKHNVMNYNLVMQEDDKKCREYTGTHSEYRMDENVVEKGYLAAKKYCSANNIQIYNATRGGALEVFPRITLEEVLK